MKEKQVIEKLQLLRSVQPDDSTFLGIHNRVASELFVKKSFTFRQWFVFPVVPFAAFVVVVLLLTVGFFPRIFEETIISARIALAPNQYEKAKIAYAYAEDQFTTIEKNTTDKKAVTSFSHALALANTEMSGLKLMGEKGKYTMRDCLTLYTTYHASLETMKNEIKFEPSGLLNQIKQYDTQSEKKLHKYKE